MALRAGVALVGLVAAVSTAACDPRGDRELTLPAPDSAATLYAADATAVVRGNLLELRIPIPEAMFRGGRVWARSGPYFYLFSPPTQELFASYPDLAAIRVVTQTGDGREVARADLRRDELSEVQWREALYRSAIAQRDGTDRPVLLQELTRYGEDRTEFRYNPEFAGE